MKKKIYYDEDDFKLLHGDAISLLKKIEPQSIDAEINALGCAFLSKEALDKVCEELNSEMFYEKKHAIIFETLKALRNKDIAVDITTVSNEVSKTPNGLSSIGGKNYCRFVCLSSSGDRQARRSILYDQR